MSAKTSTVGTFLCLLITYGIFPPGKCITISIPVQQCIRMPISLQLCWHLILKIYIANIIENGMILFCLFDELFFLYSYPIEICHSHSFLCRHLMWAVTSTVTASAASALWITTTCPYPALASLFSTAAQMSSCLLGMAVYIIWQHIKCAHV